MKQNRNRHSEGVLSNRRKTKTTNYQLPDNGLQCDDKQKHAPNNSGFIELEYY